MSTLLVALPAAMSQTSTVIVVPTPLLWQDAMAYCSQIGHAIYPVPATPTDAVYEVLDEQMEDRFWIARRAGGTCTLLNKNLGGDRLEEASCGEVLPFFCKEG